MKDLLLFVMITLIGFQWGYTQQSLNRFGEEISIENVQPLNTVLQNFNEESISVTFKTQVAEVCHMSGCWMDLVHDEPGRLPIFVTFKDQAFHMPKDIKGKEVIVAGVLKKTQLSEEEYKEKLGKIVEDSEIIENYSGPYEELEMEASSVIIFE